jgi:7-keto-8-aminopelargonate synthetase-like enzyme
MGPVESNPFSESDDTGAHILPDKSSQSAFWSHLGKTLDDRKQNSTFRSLRCSRPLGPTNVWLDGKELIHFGSNDYLAMSWHPDVIQAASSNSLPVRIGCGASPLLLGHGEIHAKLIQTVASYTASDAALVYSSGYAANLGVVSALASKQDVIFSDRLNHASLIDGCRLSGAQVIVYPHCDLDALRQLVRKHRGEGRFAFVVTDSVFSMDGDLAPLTGIVELCEAYDMQCIVDEAHATGVYGLRGRGLCEHWNLHSQCLIHVGTLSKAVGCVGGFVSGNAMLIDWLTNMSRSWIYSTGGTIPSAAAACTSLSIQPKNDRNARWHSCHQLPQGQCTRGEQICPSTFL